MGLLEHLSDSSRYRKSCQLPIKVGHKAYLIIQALNFDTKVVEDRRMTQLNELDELRLEMSYD